MEKIWVDIEHFNQIEVPMCLKFILSKCGYDTMLSLKYISETAITEIECHVRKYKNKIFSDGNDMDQCLHEYKNQDLFTILPGHRSILLDLPQCIRKMQAEKTLYGDGNTNVMTNVETVVDTSSAVTTTDYSAILNELIKSAKTNQNKPKNAYTYEDIIKHFSTYIFLLCGKTCYDTLSANLPIPGTKSIREFQCFRLVFKHYNY